MSQQISWVSKLQAGLKGSVKMPVTSTRFVVPVLRINAEENRKIIQEAMSLLSANKGNAK